MLQLQDMRENYQGMQIIQKLLEKSGLLFSAFSPDGLLPEAIEIPDHPWFVGVQFHPESIASDQGHELLKNFLDIVTGGGPA